MNPRQRYYVESVADFLATLLAHQPAEVRATWGHLPDLIRAHRAPIIYCRPETKITDLVRHIRPRGGA